MRYEVYGVYNNTGVNFGPIGVFKAQSKAIECAKSQVPMTCEFWAVLVKHRKHTYPCEIIAGRRGQDPVRATMLVSPNKYGNPIQHAEDGAKYWNTW